MKREKPELISVTEARELLGVSHTKLWQFMKDGTLTVYTSPLDKRKKLVSKAEVLSLKDPRPAAA